MKDLGASPISSRPPQKEWGQTDRRNGRLNVMAPTIKVVSVFQKLSTKWAGSDFALRRQGCQGEPRSTRRLNHATGQDEHLTTCALSMKRVKRSKVAAPRPVFQKTAAEAITSGCGSSWGRVSKQHHLRKCRQSTLPTYTLCLSACSCPGQIPASRQNWHHCPKFAQ